MKIEIQNLCKTIKKVPILQDITVTFESGKIYGLKGKNGSGKTMLMRAISGLIIPAERLILMVEFSARIFHFREVSGF